MKDKYEKLKPEVFEYEDKMDKTMYLFGILSIIVMIGILILFAAFVWVLFQTIPDIIKG